MSADAAGRAGATPPDEPASGGRERLGEVARLFLRLGLTAFGGPTAHLALMRHETVVARRWVTDQEFLDLLGAANLLPGPTSTEVAIALGRARAGRLGMLVAGALFILPAALAVTVLAAAYVRFGTTPEAGWLLYGVQPVVVAVVLQALVGLGTTALRDAPSVVVAAAAALLFLAGVNPLLILLGGGAAMLLWRQRGRLSAGRLAVLAPASIDRLTTAAVAPGGVEGLASLFLVFLKIGLLVFGSGYVLVAFLRADLVGALGLVTDRQLLDAVAVGQLTPGPLFTAATFLGYLIADVPGAVAATAGVFLPAFALVALVHPMVPRLRRSPVMSGFLDGVNATSLGLIAGVVVELARAAIIDLPTLGLGLAAAVVLLGTRLNPAWVVLAGGAAGLVLNVVR